MRTEEAFGGDHDRLNTLEQKPEGVDTDLELIPGAGHHSAPGKVALKPACEELLKKRSIAFEEASAGSFNVHVKGKGNKVAVAASAAPAEPAPMESAPSAAPAESKAEDATTPAKGDTQSKKEKTKSCCLVM